MKFLDYAGLFAKVMEYIQSKLDQNTKLVVIPSTNEINHIYPMPQPAMKPSMFRG